MAVLLLNLRQVPEDEAQDIRELLDQHDLAFYETPTSFWGVSGGAIWLNDVSQKEHADELLKSYQQAREEASRLEYQRRLAEGEVDTLLRRIFRHPFRFIFIMAVIVFIAYISVRPFFSIG